MLVTDTSGSMLATDVAPDPPRRRAGGRRARSTKKVPDEFRLGLVTFGNGAEQLVEPTTDRGQIAPRSTG